MMNKTKMISPYRLSWSVIIYGTYAALCHVVAVYLYTVYQSQQLCPEALSYKCAPMLEHTLMTLALTIGGAALILYICKKTNSDTHSK